MAIMRSKLGATGIFLGLALLFSVNSARATILWMGGEDIDFPDLSGGGAVLYDSCGTYCRAAYARHGIKLNNWTSWVMSKPFAGGAVTSAWLSVRLHYNGGSTEMRHVGFGKSGSGPVIGIGKDNYDMSVFKYNGTSWVELATVFPEPPNGLNKIDMQITNYGTSGNVKIYVNSGVAPALDFTGNIAGISADLDTVFISGTSVLSEIIVSDTDTRQLSLATLAPNAAGDLTQWSGACTTLAPTTASPAAYISTDVAENQMACNLTNLNAAIPSNSRIVAVKTASYGYTPGGPVTSYALGVKTNATISSPTAIVQDASWKTNETYYPVNPVTATSWTIDDLNALQLYLKSAAP